MGQERETEQPLNGDTIHRPKEHYGRMVAEQAEELGKSGIFVPRIFYFNETVEFYRAGGDLLIRSEHPDECPKTGIGPSGLFNSFPVAHQNIPRFTLLDENLQKHILTALSSGNISRLEEQIRTYEAKRSAFEYCLLVGRDPKDYLSLLSHSYWEYIDGIPVTVAADYTKPERYTLFAETHGKRALFIVDQGMDIQCRGKITTVGKFLDFVPQAINAYQKISTGIGWDSRNPIMEMVVNERGVWFLQHMPTRESVQPDHRIADYPDNAIKAAFVRGITPAEGMTINIANLDISSKIQDSTFLSIGEILRSEQVNGMINNSWARMTSFNEYLASSGQLVVVPGAEQASLDALLKCTFHGFVSPVMKPRLTMAIDETDYIKLTSPPTKRILIDKGNYLEIVTVRAVADGERGYLEILDESADREDNQVIDKVVD